MANFRTHTAWATAVGVATVGLSWYGLQGAGLATVGLDALILAVIAAVIGGVVPDLDHDTGTGLVEVSALLSTALPVVAAASLAEQGVAVWRSWGLLALLPAHAGMHALLRRQEQLGARSGFFASLRAVCVAAACAFGFTLAVPIELPLPEPLASAPGGVWLLLVAAAALIQLIVPIFKRVTVHRGVFHTVPFVGCYALACVAFFSALSPAERLVIGLGAFLGGLSHLILDEIYAVDFDGVRLKTKRSFGTAVSFWKARYPVASTAVYVLLIALGGLVVAQLHAARAAL